MDPLDASLDDLTAAVDRLEAAWREDREDLQRLKILYCLQRIAARKAAEKMAYWKANHDNQVTLRRMVTSRPDLPMRMHPEREGFLQEVARLEREASDLRESMKRIAEVTGPGRHPVIDPAKAMQLLHAIATQALR